MVEKRNLIAAFAMTVIIVAASVGFFEWGMTTGLTKGYQNGFYEGKSSTIIQGVTEVQLQPNQSLLIATFPLPFDSIILSYSFVVATPFLKTGTVEMNVSALGHLAFSTGYRSNASGYVSVKLNETPLNIIFKANKNNTVMIVMEITSPLMAIPQ
ncbi:MAG: hypothetical protein ACYCT2_06205 [Thermoplasmataceae archaeon]